MDQATLRKYADLLVATGVNLQEGQILVVSCPVECAPFARLIAEAAYKRGARQVVMNWGDEQISRLTYLHAPDDVFDEFPEWRKEFYLSLARKGAAFLSIAAADPEAMKGVDPNRIMRSQIAANQAIKEYADRMMSNKNRWLVASVPTKAWAKKVFPHLNEEEAVEKLWEAIIQATRADHDDPIQAWKDHSARLHERVEYLNKIRFKELHFKNSLGTDLVVELPEKHLWAGGSEVSADGIPFNPNIPSEEVFTLPKKDGVNGIVYSSKPLNYHGQLIDSFSLTFKEGKIVDFTAKVGYDALKSLIETDEGSRYLGEVALVPYDSPISKSNILFYNTLFDENASCHLAIGRAYPTSLIGGNEMTAEELASQGANYSITHVDFMFGTEDLDIIGITKDGKTVQVFKDGNFVI